MSRVNVKVEPRSTFTFTGDHSYIAPISFTHVNFTLVRTGKLRDGGNRFSAAAGREEPCVQTLKTAV